MEMDQKLCLLEMTRKFMSMTAQFKHQHLPGHATEYAGLIMTFLTLLSTLKIQHIL